MNEQKTFTDYEANFKAMLVCRYNWSVSNANEFVSAELQSAFEEQLSVEEAYFKIFNKEQDLMSL